MLISCSPTDGALTILVADAGARYPIRIDPTFSDANWVSMGGLPGASGAVRAVVTDGAGNLYIGGSFDAVGDVVARRVARWNGTAWSALGSGIDSHVRALALDGGGNLYAGGEFTTVGGASANYIARWDGNAWLPLGNGVNYWVFALAVDGVGNLYAGGDFTTAGDGDASRVARWDGVDWSPLGSGVDGTVRALAVDGSGNLYAGGSFSTAGNKVSARIARATFDPPFTIILDFLPGIGRNLGFEGRAGWSYTLLRSVSLTQGDWEPVPGQTDIPCTETGPMTLSDTQGQPSQAFYRVVGSPTP